MPRIRTIKPEFWDSPDTTRAGLRARLLYIAMWNWADDWGVGDGNPRRLLGFAFPSDEYSEVEPRNFRHLAAEVENCFGVEWYEVGGRQYYSIPSWEEHQRTEKRAQRKNPPPDQGKRVTFIEVTEVPSPSDGNVGEGTGELGNRKREIGSSTPTESVVALRVSDQPATANPKAGDETAQTLVGEWIDHCEQRPPGRVIGQVSREIKTMLDEGIDYQRIRAGLAEWNTKGLHPSTLPSVVHELGNRRTTGNRRQSETDAIFDAAMERARAAEAGDA